jgi:hypothetical protein
VICAGLTAPYGKLYQVDLPNVIKALQKRLQRSSFLHNRMVIGGVDISLNLEDNAIQHWQLHLYLLVEGKDTEMLETAVQAAFPQEPTAAKPYFFEKVSNPSAVITYAYKAIFKRRSSYIKNGAANVRDLPLKARDLRELLRFLGRYPVGVRLLLHGVRRNGKPFQLQPTRRRSRQAAPVAKACADVS